MTHSFIYWSIQVFIECLLCSRHILGPKDAAVNHKVPVPPRILACMYAQCRILDLICFVHLYMHSFVYSTNSYWAPAACWAYSKEWNGKKILVLMELSFDFLIWSQIKWTFPKVWQQNTSSKRWTKGSIVTMFERCWIQIMPNVPNLRHPRGSLACSSLWGVLQ